MRLGCRAGSASQTDPVPLAGVYKQRVEMNISVADMAVVHAGYIGGDDKARAGLGA